MSQSIGFSLPTALLLRISPWPRYSAAVACLRPDAGPFEQRATYPRERIRDLFLVKKWGLPHQLET